MLRHQQLQAGQSWRLPFVKVAPNAAYLVPVFKIERTTGGKESKRQTTLEHFRQVAKSEDPAAEYFAEANLVLEAHRFIAESRGGPEQEVSQAYAAAVAEIVRAEGTRSMKKGEAGEKATPLLVVATDPAGNVWPGDDGRLVEWLLGSPERLSIYGEAEDDLPPTVVCPLCSGPGPLYSNALAGAGLNVVNGAFRGSFPEMSEERAWQRFAVCSSCADLLYVYRNHVAPDYLDYILGSKALVVPAADADAKTLAEFARKYRQSLGEEKHAGQEKHILRWVARNKVPFATVSLVWADFGQKYENIRGIITHVLPSRLAELEEKVNDPHNGNPRRDPLYPQNQELRRKIDVNLGLPAELLRTGGKAGRRREQEPPPLRPPQRDWPVCAPRHRSPGRGPFLAADRPDSPGLLDRVAETRQRRRPFPVQLGGAKGTKGEAAAAHALLVGAHVYAFLDYLRQDLVNVLPKEAAVVQCSTEESLRPLLAEGAGAG